MNKTITALLGTVLAGTAGIASAEHGGGEISYAQVTNTSPIYDEVAYRKPREHCWQESVVYQRESHSAAPILGAIIGGVLGNELGHGRSNRRVGTFIGAAVGASVGSEIARGHQHGGRHVLEERCEMIDEIHYRQEVVGYHVTYRYHGRDYHTRMSHDPGKRIKVRVQVTPFE